MSDLVERILSRIGSEFDGECHLSEAEAREICDRITALEKENAELRKALDETAEVLDLMDSDGVRAAAFNNVPEDGLIRELCERIGYGAVMDSAARQWFKKDSVGAITTGTCAGTLRNLKALVRTALRDGGANDIP